MREIGALLKVVLLIKTLFDSFVHENFSLVRYGVLLYFFMLNIIQFFLRFSRTIVEGLFIEKEFIKSTAPSEASQAEE